MSEEQWQLCLLRFPKEDLTIVHVLLKRADPSLVD
jgi:hypothetical protein